LNIVPPNNRTKLLAGALLKNDLDNDERMNAALFAAAFEELDGLSDRLSRIPTDVDASADRFQRITTQAVDDFVFVANEALSKFMQRTNEIKAVLEPLQQPIAQPLAQPPIAPPAAAPVLQALPTSINDALWRIVPASIAFGIVLGAAIAYFVLK
jgi:hypothetical protein